MLCETMEIRWFFETPGRRQALEMLRRASGFDAAAEESRTDRYLRLPFSDGIGIKLRENRLEHKWLLRHLPGVETDPPLNRFGCWRKWSVARGEETGAPPPDDWLPVRKQRRTSPWTWSEGRARPLPGITKRATRCDVEVARVEIEQPDAADPRPSWTLCFESEGPDRRALLESVLEIFLDHGLGEVLDQTEPTDYPAWLRLKESASGTMVARPNTSPPPIFP
ncbi:MAG: hypothetical protein ACLFRP_00560 [Puniceicoccaceae bacterium]